MIKVFSFKTHYFGQEINLPSGKVGRTVDSDVWMSAVPLEIDLNNLLFCVFPSFNLSLNINIEWYIYIPSK